MAPTPERPRRPRGSADLFLSFYDDVLAVVATVSEDRLFRAMADLVLKHALKYLADNDVGVQLLVLSCLPPLLQTDPVTSLYVSLAEGTSPWSTVPRATYQFHGAESLAGYVTKKMYPMVSQDILKNPEHLPLRSETYARSTAAYPLLQTGRVAGCLQVLSTQPNYFSLERLDMLRRYANLLALAFHCQDFYDPQSIAFHLMPPFEAQHPFLSSFRRRVQAALRKNQTLNLLQAEWQVLREAERELRE